MNFFPCFFLALLIFGFGGSVKSQPPPKAILVDEFDASVVCENLASRVDVWAQEVVANRDQIGYAIIFGPKESLLKRMHQKESIRGRLRWRFRRDPETLNRFVIIEGGASPEIKVQLYRSHSGDRSILSQENKWDLTLPIAKASILYRSQDDPGICPDVDPAKQFNDLIRSNSSLRGHVVFYEVSKKAFDIEKLQFIKRLEGVAVSRFRFFRPQTHDGGGHYEFWLVPKMK